MASLENSQIKAVPVEISQQYIQFEINDPENNIARLDWVQQNWQNAVNLVSSHADFKLAIEAYEMSTFIPHNALALVSLWGALEVLFSPSTTELRFRVSVLIASYMHPPGEERAKLQKEIFDLYDKRSAAAHGKPKHKVEHLMQTFTILRHVLIRMIEDKKVPSKDTLNDMLLGVQY